MDAKARARQAHRLKEIGEDIETTRGYARRVERDTQLLLDTLLLGEKHAEILRNEAREIQELLDRMRGRLLLLAEDHGMLGTFIPTEEGNG